MGTRWLCENVPPFLSFPYVCPEPVLGNYVFHEELIENHERQRRSSPNGGGEFRGDVARAQGRDVDVVWGLIIVR